MLKWLAENKDPASLAAHLRRRRFDRFLSFIRDVPPPVRILDIGGTQHFWVVMGVDRLPRGSVTILNLTLEPVTLPNFHSVQGDARALTAFGKHGFDVVFSNSVIEHVGSLASQRSMASEIMRVGKRYFVQTPNKFFPLEPHFLVPGFQFLPAAVRAWLLNHFDVGWWKRIPDPARARAEIESIRLLTRRELKILFPGSQVWTERFLGLPKSFVVYGYSR